jgi:hypothetical protein
MDMKHVVHANDLTEGHGRDWTVGSTLKFLLDVRGPSYFVGVGSQVQVQLPLATCSALYAVARVVVGIVRRESWKDGPEQTQ